MKVLLTLGSIVATATADMYSSATSYFLRNTLAANEFLSYNAYCQHTVDNFVFDYKELQRSG